MKSYGTITPEVLGQRLTVGSARLVDVRNFDEFESVHVVGAECVPLSQVLRRASAWSPQDELILVCHSGQRAREAAEQLNAAGFSRIAVVDGGTQACIAARVPVRRGSPFSGRCWWGRASCCSPA